MQQSANQVQRQQQALQAANLANRQTQSGTPNSAGGPSPPTATMPAPNLQQQVSSANGAINPPRPSSSQGQLPNGLTPNAAVTMGGMPSGMPAAQMQALMAQQQQNMQNQQRMPNQQNTEAIRLAMQRQGMILQQQQNLLQSGGMANHNSNLAAAHLSPANAGMQNPQMLAAMAAARQNQGHMNGVGNSMGGGGNQTSPRVNHVGVAGVGTGNGTLSSGHTPTINTIMQQVHQQNPTLPIEQVRMIAQERLKGYLQRIQQQAVTAAAGNSPIANNMSMNMMNNMSMAGMGGMANMGMMNGMNMAGMNVNGLGNMGQIPGGGISQQQYQAQLQRQLAAQQQAQRMSAGSAGSMNMGGMSPAMGQAQASLSRSATPAQGVQMMHTRSGSGAGMDLTGSPLLQ